MARASYFHESAAHFVSEGVPVEAAEAGVVFVRRVPKKCQRYCRTMCCAPAATVSQNCVTRPISGRR